MIWHKGIETDRNNADRRDNVSLLQRTDNISCGKSHEAHLEKGVET